VLSVVATAITFDRHIPYRWADSMVTLAPFLLLIAAAGAADLRRSSFLAAAPLVRLGRWAFSLSMTHLLVLRLFTAVVVSPRAQVILLLPVFVLCILVAGAAFRWFEQPMERLLRGVQR